MKFRHLPEMVEPSVITPDYKIFVKQEPTVPKSLSSTLCHCNSKSNEAIASVLCVGVREGHTQDALQHRHRENPLKIRGKKEASRRGLF